MGSTPSKYLQVPRGSGVIDRPRLLDRLQSAWSYRLTLITAPPGYGKTTLAAQFARTQSGPVIWHSIEERERDVPNLYSQCISALAEVLPNIKQISASYGYAPGELGALLADYLRENLRDDIIFILDDVHLLAGASAAESWLRALVSLVPPACHLILMSRIVPDLPLIDMIARREVLAIGQEELRLTTQEISWLGYTLVGIAPADDRVQELASRLEGWPAGIALALQPLPSDLQAQVLQGKEGPEALFAALARTMLDAQPAAMRYFLLASSTLSRLTPELCISALRLPDGADMLAEVQSQNLFLSRVPGSLVYHTLFRSFLQRQFALESPDLHTAFHERAAQWFEDNDLLDSAFDHYMTVGQLPKASEIAERVVPLYFAEGKVETLLDWNNRLSDGGAHLPRLLYRCAIIHTERYEYEAAEDELRRAEMIFTRQNDRSGQADVRLQQGNLKIQQGDYPAVKALVVNLLSVAPEPSNIRGRALNIFGFACLQTDDTETGVKYLEEALPFYREYADAYALSQLLQNLGNAYWRLGRLKVALGYLQEVVALRRSLGGASALAVALNVLGYYYGQLGDYKQALTALQEGLSILARLPNRRYESYLLLNLADVQRNRGAYTEALSHYRRALATLGNDEPSLRCTILTNLSTLYRWQGHLTEAISMAEEATTLASRYTFNMEGGLARMAHLVAYAQRSQSERTVDLMEAIANDLRQRGENFALLQGLGLCAHVAVLSDHPAAALRFLQTAIAHADKLGTIQPLVSEVLHSSALETFVESSRANFGPLLREIRRLRDSQVQTVEESRPPAWASQTTYNLRVFCLGQARILRDGQPIDSTMLRRVGRDMFLYLLFVGPGTRDQISAVFWPDSSVQKVRQNFHTTLFRIRQVLGENAVILQNYQYRINAEVNIWCDAVEIEDVVRKARLLPPRDARTEDLWRRAVSFYQGDFLPDVDAEWAVSRRESLRETYIDALVGLGECARARQDMSAALTVFKDASELEPYREDIHQRIITCYAAKGDKQKIQSHLTKVKKIFRRDLGAEPSAATLALARDLLR